MLLASKLDEHIARAVVEHLLLNRSEWPDRMTPASLRLTVRTRLDRRSRYLVSHAELDTERLTARHAVSHRAQLVLQLVRQVKQCRLSKILTDFHQAAGIFGDLLNVYVTARAACGDLPQSPERRHRNEETIQAQVEVHMPAIALRAARRLYDAPTVAYQVTEANRPNRAPPCFCNTRLESS